jgi:DNA ligase-1
METFTTLYKKSSTGKIEQWEIEVGPATDGIGSTGCGVITTRFGEVGGKIQTTTDTIKSGKNIGKKNETTPFQQAQAEAQSKFEKKLKSGYVRTIEEATAGIVDSLIEGGIDPMLAHSYDKSGDKIRFPCAAQPKLDGIRCIAIKKKDSVTLWTRKRKPITSCPHIIEHIKESFSGYGILDGELYNHDLKADFEKITSVVRKEEPSEDSLLVQFHIYDGFPFDGEKLTFEQRNLYLGDNVEETEYLRLVGTYGVSDEIGVSAIFEHCRERGYEGAMLRNQHGPYENKRSYHLQKVKEFEDAEFEIVGVEEGRGKLAGLVGAFVCKTDDGTEFRVKPSGDQSATADYLQNPDKVIGRLLTVQFQGLTGTNKVPRFPVGLRIREMGL